MPAESVLLTYLVIGVGVSMAVYLAEGVRSPSERCFGVLTAVFFWPLYVPLLLARGGSRLEPAPRGSTASKDEMTAAIDQVDGELAAALGSLDGWAEDVLAREKGRFRELRLAWTTQAERIREMDRLLALPEYGDARDAGADAPSSPTPDTTAASERLRHSQQARRQNLERLRQVRQRAYEDLMATLAWVRELVSMIHLAKFTGAPAARAQELVAQIAAAVEGISETTWRDESDGEPGRQSRLARPQGQTGGSLLDMRTLAAPLSTGADSSPPFDRPGLRT